MQYSEQAASYLVSEGLATTKQASIWATSGSIPDSMVPYLTGQAVVNKEKLRPGDPLMDLLAEHTLSMRALGKSLRYATMLPNVMAFYQNPDTAQRKYLDEESRSIVIDQLQTIIDAFDAIGSWNSEGADTKLAAILSDKRVLGNAVLRDLLLENDLVRWNAFRMGHRKSLSADIAKAVYQRTKQFIDKLRLVVDVQQNNPS